MRTSSHPPALLLLAATLVSGCNDDTTPTMPSTADAAPMGTTVAGLVGAPNTWEEVALMPTGRYSAAAGAAVNANGRSIVYVFGGHDAADEEGINIFGSVEAYNIAFDRWVTKRSGALFALSGINGANNINGKVYLPGGGGETGNGFEEVRVLQVYDPVADVWTRKRDMPGASANGVSSVIDGKLYVLTGDDNVYIDGVPCPDCGRVQTRRLFQYDPVTDRWARRARCPHFHIRGVAGVINRKLYVTGGFGKGLATVSLDIYDPDTDTWTSGAPLPSEHTGGVGVVLGGLFYVVGGFTGEVVAYNPKTNRWLQKAPFPVPTARFMSGAKVTLNGKARIVVQGGLQDGFPNNGRATFVYTP